MRAPYKEQRPGEGAPSKLLDPEELGTDDTAASEVLAEIHGGERRAGAWLRRTLQAVGS